MLKLGGKFVAVADGDSALGENLPLKAQVRMTLTPCFLISWSVNLMSLSVTSVESQYTLVAKNEKSLK